MHVFSVLGALAFTFLWGFVLHSWWNDRDTESLALSIDYASNPLIGDGEVVATLISVDDQMVELGLNKSHPEKYRELQDLKRRARNIGRHSNTESLVSVKYAIKSWDDGFYGGFTPMILVVLVGVTAIAFWVGVFITRPPARRSWHRHRRSYRRHNRLQRLLPTFR